MAPVQLGMLLVELKRGSGVDGDHVKTLLLHSTEIAFGKEGNLSLN